MTSFHERPEVTAFLDEIAEVIERHWGGINEANDEDADPVDVAEVGASYCSGWVLCLASASIENPTAPTASTRYYPRGQNPYLGMGLLHDVLAWWHASGD